MSKRWIVVQGVHTRVDWNSLERLMSYQFGVLIQSADLVARQLSAFIVIITQSAEHDCRLLVDAGALFQLRLRRLERNVTQCRFRTTSFRVFCSRLKTISSGEELTLYSYSARGQCFFRKWSLEIYFIGGSCAVSVTHFSSLRDGKNFLFACESWRFYIPGARPFWWMVQAVVRRLTGNCSRHRTVVGLQISLRLTGLTSA